MNKSANVVYAYAPKNDDELELKVGDKIEVIGFEEEGKCGAYFGSWVQQIEREREQKNIYSTSFYLLIAYWYDTISYISTVTMQFSPLSVQFNSFSCKITRLEDNRTKKEK